MNNYDDLLNNAPAEPQSGQLSKEEYADKKRAEREEVFALSDSTALEVAGNGGKFRQYLDVQSRFDRYSAVNALLILAQKPEATRIGDFDYWKGIGGFVRPRQSAISILEPHEYLKEDGSPGIGYNIKYNGMTAERFLWAWICSAFLIPKRLMFRATNIYYEALKPILEGGKRG
jgi:hypothetical protein